MPNIDEARAGIMSAHQSAQQGLAELSQAHRSLEDAQNGLRHGTEGSNQPEADQANAQLAEAITKVEEARQQVASALQEFEGVAQRL
jgi:prefoldin subunit 5